MIGLTKSPITTEKKNEEQKVTPVTTHKYFEWYEGCTFNLQQHRLATLFSKYIVHSFIEEGRMEPINVFQIC